MATTTRKAVLSVVLIVVSSFSGCLTLGPTVTADTDNSTVFKDLSSTEAWAGQAVRVRATLKSSGDAANVTQITIIKENGRTFQTQTIDPGQTTVVLILPVNQNATIVSSNSVNSTTIEELNVTTEGNRII